MRWPVRESCPRLLDKTGSDHRAETEQQGKDGICSPGAAEILRSGVFSHGCPCYPDEALRPAVFRLELCICKYRKARSSESKQCAISKLSSPLSTKTCQPKSVEKLCKNDANHSCIQHLPADDLMASLLRLHISLSSPIVRARSCPLMHRRIRRSMGQVEDRQACLGTPKTGVTDLQGTLQSSRLQRQQKYRFRAASEVLRRSPITFQVPSMEF